MFKRFDIGVLYSRSGTYQPLSEALFVGAMSAIEDVNQGRATGVKLNPVIRDPASDLNS